MKLRYMDHDLGQILLRYIHDAQSGRVFMLLLPKGEEEYTHKRREWLEIPELQHNGLKCPAWIPGNLCHLSLRHLQQSDGAGQTLKHGAGTLQLRFVKQTVDQGEQCQRICTVLQGDGYQVVHRVMHYHGVAGVEIITEFQNLSQRPMTLELLTSFSLDGLSPFDTADSSERLVLHRFRGGWSLEGRHCAQTTEELGLERTWYNAFSEGERFGSLGSYPVGKWFPTAAVEDRISGVTWAAQVAVNSSWQMELTRSGDSFSFSGGLADREFGSWWKKILPGECFVAPKAFVSVAKGGVHDACQRLTALHHRYVDRQPESEQHLPILFNDWCSSWGSPSQEKILNIARTLKQLPIEYLTIDAGWSRTENPGLGQGGNGDWETDMDKFPGNIKAVSQELKKQGLKTGIWFEFEVTTRGARVFEPAYHAQHLLRDGEIILSGPDRSFWDFRQESVRKYLREKVIDFLKENEIGYLKVDYNGCVGVGCDGAESPGEGLRQQMQAVRDFFLGIRRELPELVIENCASGGHRLEASMMDITAMSSFSDSHECRNIPYLAADLHDLILPRQSQIWSVLHEEMSCQELEWRISCGLLGRLCLSGEVSQLSEEQKAILSKGLAFYRAAVPVIKRGFSRVFRNCSENRSHLRGTQAVVRISEDGKTLLVVCHSFEEGYPDPLRIELPEGKWEIVSAFGQNKLVNVGDSWAVSPMEGAESFALLMKRGKD